jgi:hypothetical protein
MDMKEIIKALDGRKVKGIRQMDEDLIEILFEDDTILSIKLERYHDECDLELSVEVTHDNWITVI